VSLFTALFAPRKLPAARLGARGERRAAWYYEAVNRKKRERMIRLGDQYATQHPEVHLRYDILSLYWTGRRFIVTHYPDAFRPVADARRPWIWRA
jgi:Holliday junction resolvase-like predicted endonuclease